MTTSKCKKCKHLRKRLIFKPTRGRDYICGKTGLLLCKGAGYRGNIMPIKEVSCPLESKNNTDQTKEM